MLGRFVSLSILSAMVALSAACATTPQEEEEEAAAGELNSALDDPAKGVHTDALLVMRDGVVLTESYGRGYNADTKHLSWSMAKTIAGILVAQEIDRGSANRGNGSSSSRANGNRGTMSLTSPIRDYLPEIRSGARVVDVLQMSSGIAFNEEYAGVPVTSDATRMLYMDGPKSGFVPFVATLSQRTDARPGDHFYYSSGDTNLLMAALRSVAPSQQAYDAMPFERFFQPLGIARATFEQDSEGIFVGSSYIYLTARDFGKIGTLMVERGKHGGETIIPGWYFDLMSRVAPGVSAKALAGTSQTRAYSSMVTTNLPISARGLPSEYADLPTDALLMIGHQGQLVVASPSQKLVIVRLAMDKGSSFDRKQFFAKVIRLVEAKSGPIATARKDNPAQYVGATPPHPPPTPDADTERAKIADYLKIPHLIRALAAKEYCSCIKVVGRSESDCKDDLRVSLPILPTLRVNDENGSVSAVLGTGIFGKKSVAVYRGPELGCTLTESE